MVIRRLFKGALNGIQRDWPDWMDPTVTPRPFARHSTFRRHSTFGDRSRQLPLTQFSPQLLSSIHGAASTDSLHNKTLQDAGSPRPADYPTDYRHPLLFPCLRANIRTEKSAPSDLRVQRLFTAAVGVLTWPRCKVPEEGWAHAPCSRRLKSTPCFCPSCMADSRSSGTLGMGG